MGVSRRTRRLSTSAALALVLALAGAASPASRPGGPGATSATLADATLAQDAQPNASVTVVGPSGSQTLPPAIRIAATGPSSGGAVQADIADVLLKAYRAAVARSPEGCHLPVSLLAAIGQVESGSLVGRPIDRAHRTSVLGPVLDGHGYAAIPDTDGGQWDGNATWDRAVGPMQFIPGSWRTFGVDADGDGLANPQDVEDAAASTAAYLCYGGRDLSDPTGLRTAILSYNHSVAYLRLVLTYQERFAGLGLDDGTTVAGLPTHLALSAVEASPDGWAAGRVSAHAPSGKASRHRTAQAKSTQSARPTPSASASASASGTPSGTPSPAAGTPTVVAAPPPTVTTPGTPSTSPGPSTSPDPTPSKDPPPSKDPGSPSPDPTPTSTCPTAPPDPDATPSQTDTPSPTPTDGTCPPCPPGTDPSENAPCLPDPTPSTEPAPDPSPSSLPPSPTVAATTDASSSSVP